MDSGKDFWASPIALSLQQLAAVCRPNDQGKRLVFLDGKPNLL